MIDVCVAQDDGVDVVDGEGKRLPVAFLVFVAPLYQPALEQHGMAARPYHVQGPGDLARRAEEL